MSSLLSLSLSLSKNTFFVLFSLIRNNPDLPTTENNSDTLWLNRTYIFHRNYDMSVHYFSNVHSTSLNFVYDIGKKTLTLSKKKQSMVDIYMWEWSAIGYYFCQIHDKITFIFLNIYNHFPSMSLVFSRLYYLKRVYQQSRQPSIIATRNVKLFTQNVFRYNTFSASFYNVFMKKHDDAPSFKFDCSFLNWSKSFQYFFRRNHLLFKSMITSCKQNFLRTKN
jgi:hypothetical protein